MPQSGNTLRRLLLITIAVAVGLPWFQASAGLVAAVLPGSRSVRVNQYASFFATIINTGPEALENCGAVVRNDPGGTFWFRPTNPSNNFPIGERSTTANVAPGAAQSFFLEYRHTSELPPIELEFNFVCDNVAPAAVASGVNTLLFSASTLETPDVVALTSTITGDGIVNLPIDGSPGVFAAATSNVGAAGNITVEAVGGGAASGVNTLVCKTNSFTGACEAAPARTTNVVMSRRSTHTFAVFLDSQQNIDFDPAKSRITLQFKDNFGAIRGATSVAVRSADLTISGVPPASVLVGDTFDFTPTVGIRPGRTEKYTMLNQPDWLTLSDTGRLIGEPGNADAGLYSQITLSVSDGINLVSLPPFDINVIASAWREEAALPDTTSQHSMSVVDDRLFYFGARVSDFTAGPVGVREYSATLSTWISRASMLSRVLRGSAHAIDGEIYLFGGNGVNASSSINSVQIFDPVLERYTQQTMPFNRYGFASAEVDGLVYFFGGYNYQSRSASNELRIFNSTTGEWTFGPAVPVRCDGSSAAAIGSLIYLTGGCNVGGNTQVNVFDTVSGSWSATTAMPVSLAYHQSASLGGKVYVIGGYKVDSTGSGAAQNTVFEFDPLTDQWQQLQSMRTARDVFGAAVYQGEIWVSGGFRTDSVEVFTPN